MQNTLCEVDADDIEGKIDVIRSLFEDLGMSFETYYADKPFASNRHLTNLDNAPSLLFGVWHPKQSAVTPVVFIPYS